jgi:hypothetical protein
MISLSDSELAAVMAAARPIDPRERDAFLRDVVAELAKYPELRDGQKEFLISLPGKELLPKNRTRMIPDDFCRAERYRFRSLRHMARWHWLSE